MNEELLQAVKTVQQAWNDSGPAPAIHEREMLHLWQHWPTLARAVSRLARLEEDVIVQDSATEQKDEEDEC